MITKKKKKKGSICSHTAKVVDLDLMKISSENEVCCAYKRSGELLPQVGPTCKKSCEEFRKIRIGPNTHLRMFLGRLVQ